MDQQLLEHIVEVAKIPSFSSYEDRLHPYIRSVAKQVGAKEIRIPGHSLVFTLRAGSDVRGQKSLAFASHMDKNNHYGKAWNQPLEVVQKEQELEGPMDDSVGVGICLRLMEWLSQWEDRPTTYFYFSEMEESLGLKKHPEWLKDGGEGLTHGMGAQRIAQAMIDGQTIPDEVITVDTTPLFKGDPGIALYANHWEYNELEPSDELKEATDDFVDRLQKINSDILVSNNTNDYLIYGFEFNQQVAKPVVSVAIEPSIYPYHQAGERVYYQDVQTTYETLVSYLKKH
jgi:hypothetical protein